MGTKEERIKKKNFSGQEVEVLGPTYEEGSPEKPENWRGKLEKREEMLRYLQNGERYWFSKEGYGSEKRKTPA